MHYENITLCKLALASTMYNSLTPFNNSLAVLNSTTRGNIDLENPLHRIALIKWLNDWGCRHLAEEQHEVVSLSISSWYQANVNNLFSNEKPLWNLENHELEAASWIYGSLKDSTGAWRIRSGRKIEIHIGETAASKILFAIRPKALMPWDEAMRVSFQCDGSPKSYLRYLKMIRDLTLHMAVLCKHKGFRIDDLPQKLGRPDSTVIALVNEYIWITETRKVELPSSSAVAQWTQLG